MYGKEYMEWREAEDAMIRFENDLESLDPGARAILQAQMRKRYGPPADLMSDLQQVGLQGLLQRQFVESQMPSQCRPHPIFGLGGLLG